MSMTSKPLTGSQLPRIANYPDYDSTAGDLAIAFAEKLGIKLDPWQQFVVRHGLGQVTDPLDPTKKIWAADDVGLMVPRQNGKSYIIDVLILAGLFIFDERIILTSQNRANSKKIFLRVVEKIKTAPKKMGLRKKLAVKWLVSTNGNEEIKLRSGAFLQIRARGKNARGDTIDRLINDEAYDYSDDDQAALNYMLSVSPNPQAWYLSTPALDTVTGAPFTNLRQRGHIKAERVAWFEWSVDAEKPVDLDDRKLWAQANPAFNIRLRETRVIAERSGDPEGKGFARERLGIWPVATNLSLLTPADWAALEDDQTTTPDPVALAVDISPDRSKACIVAWTVDEQGMGRTEVIAHEDGTDWVVPRLVDLKKRINPVTICVDQVGPAGSLILALNKAGITEPQDREKPRYGDLAIIRNGYELGAAFGQFVDAVKQKTFRHPGDPLLTVAVANAEPRSIGDGAFGWSRKKPDLDITCLVATTNARWAYESRAHLVKRKSDPGAWLV
ncbi:hypothetical protein O7630_06675 [Micromonospora sp. WMMD718]|uniref:hypothetical protein n=1 Tax=unclassified Micromonospora TaxID=2617518 RepID=UPI000A9C8592|nr:MULTISPECIES: hypothetical protein [unclassified Micromonospora]MDG4750615.1 hypothetical protein [Micromonospora sp. WMMD718]